MYACFLFFCFFFFFLSLFVSIVYLLELTNLRSGNNKTSSIIAYADSSSQVALKNLTLVMEEAMMKMGVKIHVPRAEQEAFHSYALALYLPSLSLVSYRSPQYLRVFKFLFFWRPLLIYKQHNCKSDQ